MSQKKYNIAVVGAGGLVGRTMVKIIEERNFPVESLRLFATSRSAGTEVNFRNKKIKIENIEDADFKGIDIALFSAGKDASVKYAPIAANNGCIVIDNGSYWRMHQLVPLIVPEVNPDAILNHKGIIANPNCSTIQLVVALKVLHDTFTLKRVVVSTYQSISGAGQKGMNKLIGEVEKIDLKSLMESNDKPLLKADYSNLNIAYSSLFHEITDESGDSVEEIKMKNETRKILEIVDLPLAVTCVRLPTFGGHGESVNIETEKQLTVQSIRESLQNHPGIILIDEPLKGKYPTPQLSLNSDEVFIGRIRIDDSVKNGAYLWVVSDNLRKGAATNAVQIAELLIEKQCFNYKATNWN